MNTAQIKEEIRKLDRTDKSEIYRWIDEEATCDILFELEKDWYAYQGPLGDVVHKGAYFFASKDGFLIGSYETFDDAIAALIREAENPN